MQATGTNIKNISLRHRTTLLYGIGLAMLLFILKWLELRYLIFTHSIEIYIGIVAVIFTALGIWLATKLSAPKIQTVVVEKQIFNRGEGFTPDKSMIAKLGLTDRETELLHLLAAGHSNQEIASQLFISLSTVKSHLQNLFEKLDVKRRMQAVEQARSMGILP